MNQPERQRIAAGYDAALKRIRSWIYIAAIVAPLAFLVWKVLVPKLPVGGRDWVFYISVTITLFAVGWFLVSWILLATYTHEKKSRLRDLS